MIIENANRNNSKQIRVLESMLETIGHKYESANGGVNRSLYLLENLEKRLAAEIRDTFTKQELLALLDANNGTLITEPFWGNQRAMVMQLEDADRYDQLGKKWNVDVPALCDKVMKLSPAAFLFLHEELYRFWNEPAYGSPTPQQHLFIEKYVAYDTPNE